MASTPSKAPVPVVPKIATTAIEIPKVEPGKDVFAEHPDIEIKSEGRAEPPAAAPAPKNEPAKDAVQLDDDAPPVGQPKTEAKAAAEEVTTAGQPGEKKADEKSTVAAKANAGENVIKVDAAKDAGAKDAAKDVKKDEVKKDEKKVEVVKPAGPIPEEDAQADRVAEALYEKDKE
jgi:hypothetical protein